MTVHLSSVLAKVVQGTHRVEVQGNSLGEALDALLTTPPALKVHLFDESGAFRTHVLCFHNDTNTRWLEDLSVPTQDGDSITILQAVSGG